MTARHAKDFTISQITHSTVLGHPDKVYSHSNVHKIPCLLYKLKKFTLVDKTETSP